MNNDKPAYPEDFTTWAHEREAKLSLRIEGIFQGRFSLLKDLLESQISFDPHLHSVVGTLNDDIESRRVMELFSLSMEIRNERLSIPKPRDTIRRDCYEDMVRQMSREEQLIESLCQQQLRSMFRTANTISRPLVICRHWKVIWNNEDLKLIRTADHHGIPHETAKRIEQMADFSNFIR